VIRDGAAALAVSAVANEADLSKVGVLHHFPSRDAMAAAMPERSVAAWDAALAANAAADPQLRGRFARADVQTSLAPSHDKARLDALSAAITATVLSFPETLDPLQAPCGRFLAAAADDGIDPVLATLIRLAADGLWLCETLGPVRFDPAPKAAVTRTRITMTQPT
jgi:AcrR family transcriptional regulator